MTKELEALEEIRDFRYGKDKLLVCQTSMYKIIKQALERLEAIDNANSSKALECLEDIYRNAVFINEKQEIQNKHKIFIESPETNKTISEQCNTIKQALLKAQEQKRVLNIIKEKNVDVYILKTCINLEHYNSEIRRKNQNNTYSYEIWYELTEEEFSTLKEWLENA